MTRLAHLAFAVAGVALFLLFASGLGYRNGLWPLGTAFQMLTWGAYAGVTALVLGLVAVFGTRRVTHRPGFTLAAVAAIVGALAVLVPYSWQRTASRVPRIHDITTDTLSPPTFVAIVPLRANAPNTLEYSPEVAAQQKTGYPDIAPLTLALPPDQAFDRALAAAKEQGWAIVAADKAAGRIEATDTTFFFGFTDDIVVRITPEANGSRIDVRSVSRIGRSDVGTNAARIRGYLSRLRDR